MNNPFIGTIISFGSNFAPRGWALCDGQLLPISQYSALFSILGTTYGGDGRTTFALPDLRGRAAVHAGRGPGLSDRRLGARSGTQSNVLNATQLASHTHVAQDRVGTEPASTDDPTNAYITLHAEDSFSDTSTASGVMAAAVVGNTGNNQALNNMAPYEVVNFIVALQGVYPSRS